MEREIAEYLLTHKEGLLEKFLKRHNPAWHLFPPAFQDVYVYNYGNNIVDLVQQELLEIFPTNYEQISCIVTKDYITMILGSDFIHPPAKE